MPKPSVEITELPSGDDLAAGERIKKLKRPPPTPYPVLYDDTDCELCAEEPGGVCAACYGKK